MHKKRIAIPIAFDSDITQIKNRIFKAVKNKPDIIELRVDYWQEPLTPDFLQSIRSLTAIPTIFTLRSQSEGGLSMLNDHERLNIIKQAIELNFAYVDIELQTLKKFDLSIYDLKKSSSTKYIISYHNFTGCDSATELFNLRDEMVERGADICKIVVTSLGEESNRLIFDVIKDSVHRGYEIIGIAMGEKGSVTRTKGPELGAYLTFISLDATTTTAPGQLTLDD